jgi:hypothetical protein
MPGGKKTKTKNNTQYLKAILTSIASRRRVHLMFMVDGQLLKIATQMLKCEGKFTMNQDYFLFK